MTELNATRNVKLWGGTTGDLLDTQLNCPAHGSDPNKNSEINSRLSSLRSIVAPFFPIQLFYLFESESTDSKMTTRELKMWGYSHCDEISFNGAVASSSLMLSLVISIWCCPFHLLGKMMQQGKRKHWPDSFNYLKWLLHWPTILLVVGIIAFFSQLEGYVKVHHDNFYGQVYSFICDGGWVGVCRLSRGLGTAVRYRYVWNNGVGALHYM